MGVKEENIKVYRVDITEGDIKRGIRNSVKYCPIALALTGLGLEGVNVRGRWAWHRGNDLVTQQINLPRLAVDFINEFDAGHEVKPFSFSAASKSFKV